MVRILVRVLGGLLCVVALLAGLVWIFQANLVKSAIEGGGTWATGVETRVAGVSAGLVGGQLAIEGLELANPAGFGSAPCLALRSARADWETRSLLSDEIRVREIALDGLVLRIERNASGTNVARILDHARGRRGAAPASPAEPAADGPGRALVVDLVVVRDLSAELVLAGLPGVEGPLRVSVPRFELRGFRSDGATHEIVGALLAAVVEAALEASLAAGADVFPKDLVRDLEGRLDAARAALEDTLRGEVDGALERAAGAAGRALEDLGILGGKKP
jgi:hypothetical protein